MPYIDVREVIKHALRVFVLLMLFVVAFVITALLIGLVMNGEIGY